MFVNSIGTSGSSLPEIANSLRFNAANSTYASRTISTPTNGAVCTTSFWVKRGKLGAPLNIMGAGQTVGTNYSVFSFDAGDTLTAADGTSGTTLVTSQVFRDPSAWLHVVHVYDSTQATSSNRLKLYINGTQVTAFSSSVYPALNAATLNNTSGYVKVLGNIWYNGSPGGYPFDGYLSNVTFIDGQALTPSSFAYTDPNGQWRTLSKAALTTLASSGGTNSFFLPFDNTTSTTTLGYDASSKGNNFTLTNMVRDGSVNDCSSLDTPTNNTCTMDVLNQSGVTISNGSLKVVTAGNNFAFRSAWKIDQPTYFEVTFPTVTGDCFVGVTSTEAAKVENGIVNSNYWLVLAANGNKINGNYPGTSYGSAQSNGAILGFAVNPVTGKMWVRDSTGWFASGDPAAGTNAAFTNLPASVLVGNSGTTSFASAEYAFNFGQRPVASGSFDSASGGYFRYTPPSGFKALNTKNIAAGSITTSGTFTGNANADGPVVWLNGTPTAFTINGNAVTLGTHADKLAGGFKVRSSSASYNASGSNTYSITTTGNKFKYANAQGNP